MHIAVWGHIWTTAWGQIHNNMRTHIHQYEDAHTAVWGHTFCTRTHTQCVPRHIYSSITTHIYRSMRTTSVGTPGVTPMGIKKMRTHMTVRRHICSSMTTSTWQYEHTYTSAWGHICNSITTRIWQYDDTYTAVSGHTYIEVRGHIYQHQDRTSREYYELSWVLFFCVMSWVEYFCHTSTRLDSWQAASYSSNLSKTEFFLVWSSYLFFLLTCILLDLAEVQRGWKLLQKPNRLPLLSPP